MKAILIGIALAVGFASYAGAAEVKQDTAPVVKTQKMSDSELDKVTAGGMPDPTRQGVNTANAAQSNVDVPAGNGFTGNTGRSGIYNVGQGTNVGHP